MRAALIDTEIAGGGASEWLDGQRRSDDGRCTGGRRGRSRMAQPM